MPSTHTVYKIDVLTQSNHWCVFRRYSEFFALDQKLIRVHGIARDLLPPKKLTGNLTAAHIETRREALERYLQKLVNSDHHIAASHELSVFLDVYEHDVCAVMKKLAHHFYLYGDELLEKKIGFCATPDQLYCITKQLKLPVYKSDAVDASYDVGHVYSFVYNVTHMTVSSAIRPLAVSSMRYDLSLFKSSAVLKG
ncbi:nischarin-like [Corticium candelabrum]|uniref:nischarin-like n=1 Tax=Corticium candelabrum TaxID=121492 RepID=UPI002E25437D|nr:nischarin-like [Corticium candelabrum]